MEQDKYKINEVSIGDMVMPYENFFKNILYDGDPRDTYWIIKEIDEDFLRIEPETPRLEQSQLWVPISRIEIHQSV